MREYSNNTGARMVMERTFQEILFKTKYSELTEYAGKGSGQTRNKAVVSSSGG